jgi:hypothetical protein
MGIGQSDSSSLHARYGEPALERFAATPQIDLLVNYGMDRQACEILLQPASVPLLPLKSNSVLRSDEGMMDEIEVSQILEELSPTASRGKAGLYTVTKSGCNEYSTAEFDTVTINRSFHRCESTRKEQEMSSEITFKRSACDSITSARMKRLQDLKQATQQATQQVTPATIQ